MMSNKAMPPSTLPPPMILYTTHGDMGAFLIYPYLFNPSGEWIGFATSNRDIYNLEGIFVGVISADQRILRKKYIETPLSQRKVPGAPPKVRAPGSIPLPPQMAELSFDVLDVLEEKPDLLHTMDHGEFRPDAE